MVIDLVVVINCGVDDFVGKFVVVVGVVSVLLYV